MDQASHAQQSYPQQQGQGTHEPGKIFVGGLSWETTQEKLKGYFEHYGEISDCVIMQDPVTKRPRGFGFVTFKDPGSVPKVLAGGPHVLDNKTVDPKPATVKTATGQGAGGGGGGGQTVTTKKIFVGGIANGTSEEEVRAYFSQFGTVSDLDLKYDKATQRMRGFGFVGFESEDVVEKLVQTHFHQINGKTVEVKKAEPRFSTTGQGYGTRSGYQPYGGNVGRGGYGSGGYGNVGAGNYGGYGYGTQQQQQQYGGGSYGGAYNYPAQSGQYGTGGYDYSGYYGRYPTQQPATATEQGRSDSSYAYPQQQQPQQQYQDYQGARSTYGSSENYGQHATSYQYDSTAGYPASGYADPQPTAGYGRGQQQQQQQPRGGTYAATYNR